MSWIPSWWTLLSNQSTYWQLYYKVATTGETNPTRTCDSNTWRATLVAYRWWFDLSNPIWVLWSTFYAPNLGFSWVESITVPANSFLIYFWSVYAWSSWPTNPSWYDLSIPALFTNDVVRVWTSSDDTWMTVKSLQRATGWPTGNVYAEFSSSRITKWSFLVALWWVTGKNNKNNFFHFFW